MTSNKKLRQLFVLSAVFAVLVASLAPPVLRAVFGQTIPASKWVEVCTVDGMQRLPAALLENEPSPNTSQDPGSHSGGHFEHCSFCVTQTCSFGLAPVEAVLLPILAAKGGYLPSHVPSAPYIELGWQPNQARAPPVFL